MRHSSPLGQLLMSCPPILLALCLHTPLSAQPQVVTTPDGKQVVIQGGALQPVQGAQAMEAMQNAKAAAEAARNAAKNGKTPPKPGETNKKNDAKKGEGDNAETLKNVTRTAEPPKPPDPKELDVIPDDDGLLHFQFRNQPWPDVLRWYAEVSGLSFDWQELPGDYINLATQRPHTLEETGDMINRALLMRGFTILQDSETLTVSKTEGLNPALVPRVQPSELSTLPPHKFVRTSFLLSWLLAEEVHEEFNSMISSNGKLTPLQSTNRLEAMDAAANLRDIHEILEQEQSAIALENLAREFPLQHARASAVKEQLEAFLGIRSASGGGGPMSSSAARMIQQQMQQMQQAMQQAARNNNNNKGGGGATRKRPDNVYLVANERSNSVIVHAPPNKMAIIASFIARVDVRNENSADYQRLNTRMKVFRLASLGPTELVESLNAMDVLEPATRLQVDENNNAIIAYASLADQYLIQSVIDRLDGSERSFEVIQLRRLDAESVAGSIKFLMGAEEEDKNQSSRNRYYGFYDYYGSRNNTPKKDDKMRVGANVQDNQLLLWANEIEMEEVNNLLVKLGELPPEGGRRSTMRVIDASRQPETYEYLQRLKEQWDKVSPNPLILPDAAEFQEETTEEEPEESTTEEQPPQPKESNSLEPSPEKITSRPPSSRGSSERLVTERLVSMAESPATQQAAETPTTAALPEDDDAQQDAVERQASAEAPVSDPAREPVKILVDEAGNLVILSEDTAALDRLEQIMQTNRPPRRPYDIFKVKHARASWVALNLKDYFDKNSDDDRPRIFSFFFDDFQDNKEKDRQLGDRPPLRFISDNDTNSIVVQGADDLDRQTIKDLIELWDVPAEEEDLNRYTRLVRIKYSRAESIVNTLKDAYRDLLSANDKAFQQGQDGNNESKRSGSGQGVQDGGGMSFAFKGKLSLGAETLTNSILVSAEGKPLLDLVCDMIEELDQAARNEGKVEVYQLPAGINGKSLEKTLRALFQTPKQQQPGDKQNNQNNPAAEAGGQPAQQTEAIQAARSRANGRRK